MNFLEIYTLTFNPTAHEYQNNPVYYIERHRQFDCKLTFINIKKISAVYASDHPAIEVIKDGSVVENIRANTAAIEMDNGTIHYVDSTMGVVMSKIYEADCS